MRVAKQVFAAVVNSALVALFLCALTPNKADAIPAFARKYGLPCSACHEAWPKLNEFGITFKDNGYQLMNERDSPIYQNPSYWPITLRMTPNWHRESQNREAVDAVPGDPASGLVENREVAHGFDLSGLDILTGGTLYKNISFLLVPSADETGAFHFESVWVRADNLFRSRWLNFKFGKFELDMPEALSEKRGLALSENGGGYQSYHFVPVGSLNDFGLGDNQLGIELGGHSRNSYTRYAVSLLSSNSGNVDFTTNAGTPATHTYDAYAHVSQAFQIPKLGLQRVGALAYNGRRPTFFITSGGTPELGAGTASFDRYGAYVTLYFGKLDYTGMWMHGKDSVFLGTATPLIAGAAALPAGARAPTWNGGINEVHWTQNPQLVFFGRYEIVRMSQQATPGAVRADLGDTDNWLVGYRWYPIMFSRAGLAFHNEYSRLRVRGTSPVTGSDLVTSSVLVGFDFDF
jgi:hypothetical protein